MESKDYQRDEDSELFTALGSFLPFGMSQRQMRNRDRKSLASTSNAKVSEDSSSSSEEEDLHVDSLRNKYLESPQRARQTETWDRSRVVVDEFCPEAVWTSGAETGAEGGVSSDDEAGEKGGGGGGGARGRRQGRRRRGLQERATGGEVGELVESSSLPPQKAGTGGKGGARLKNRLASQRTTANLSVGLSVDTKLSPPEASPSETPNPASPPHAQSRHRKMRGQRKSQQQQQPRGGVGGGGKEFGGGEFGRADRGDGSDEEEELEAAKERFGEGSSSSEENNAHGEARKVVGAAGLTRATRRRRSFLSSPRGGKDSGGSGGGEGGRERARKTRIRSPRVSAATATAAALSSSLTLKSSVAVAALARKEVSRRLRGERAAMVGEYGNTLAHVLFSACLALLALHFIGSADGVARVLTLEFKLLAGLCGASALLFAAEVVMARRRDRRVNYAPLHSVNNDEDNSSSSSSSSTMTAAVGGSGAGNRGDAPCSSVEEATGGVAAVSPEVVEELRSRLENNPLNASANTSAAASRFLSFTASPSLNRSAASSSEPHGTWSGPAALDPGSQGWNGAPPAGIGAAGVGGSQGAALLRPSASRDDEEKALGRRGAGAAL